MVVLVLVPVPWIEHATGESPHNGSPLFTDPHIRARASRVSEEVSISPFILSSRQRRMEKSGYTHVFLRSQLPITHESPVARSTAYFEQLIQPVESAPRRRTTDKTIRCIRCYGTFLLYSPRHCIACQPGPICNPSTRLLRSFDLVVMGPGSQQPTLGDTPDLQVRSADRPPPLWDSPQKGRCPRSA